MYIFTSEKKEIARVKERIHAQRIELLEEVSELLPQASKAAAMGSIAFTLKRLTPLLRPVLFGFAQRAISSRGRGKRRFLKIATLGALGFGAWKLLGNNEDPD
ncbi:hypothetical protein [Cerasicoccus arenae]|uniref:Uncharacterized protein n=1 Tax=Cerasicoccus arenae TaxID=424488 RepID=A0A8J3GE80_9BACT|nr:hypothetical protein [Cerasicoccus arenae]MBK1859198.1 hypothetical protein [Cerasicoccus arenae]GHC01221.1 hypothetical protein GCM10007047_17080 [Cerasicoccus arenae]